MSILHEPRLELRRTAKLREELFARAKAWLHDWRPRDNGTDFLGALLEIAARLESETAQRLDKMPEKMFRGYLAWLGVRGRAAQAARLPLAFSLAANSEPVLAKAPIQVQATPPQTDTGDSPEPVTFETEDDLMIVPGALASLYAVDPAEDAFYAAPDGFSSLDAPKPGPRSWTVKTTAKAGSTQIQLDPAMGLDALPTLLHKPTSLLYRVTKADGGLVTIDPPIGTPDFKFGVTASAPQDLPENDVLTLQSSFDPFGDARRNRQEHALYIGSESLLNLPTEAKIGIQGITDTNVRWSYWGKAGNNPAVGWQKLDSIEPLLTLDKKIGSVEVREIGGKSSRWLRGTVDPKTSASIAVSHISLSVNPNGCGEDLLCPQETPPNVAVEGLANTTPLVLDTPFYPLGREPRLFDAFYLGCPEAFSKSNASVRVCLEALDGTALSFTAAQATSALPTILLFGTGSDGFLHTLTVGTDPARPVTRGAVVRPPMNEAGKAAKNIPPVMLTQRQSRLSTITRDKDVLVASIAGNDVWIWSQASPTGQWYSLGTLGVPSSMPAGGPPLPGLLLSQAKNRDIHAVALRKDGKLYEVMLSPGWDSAGFTPKWTLIPLPTADAVYTVAPVFRLGARLTGTFFEDGWISVSTTGDAALFGADTAVSSSKVVKRLGDLGTIDPKVTPLAIQLDATSILMIVQKKAGDLQAWHVFYNHATASTRLDSVTASLSLGGSFDWTGNALGNIAVTFAKKSDGDDGLAAWFPSADPGTHSELHELSGIPGLSGAPALAGECLVAPCNDAAIVSVGFTMKRLDVPEGNLSSVLTVDDVQPVKDDVIATTFHGSKTPVATVLEDNATVVPGSASQYWLPIPESSGKAIDSVQIFQRLYSSTFSGEIKTEYSNSTTILPDPLDTYVVQDASLAIRQSSTGAVSLHRISKVGKTFFKVTPAVEAASPGDTISYEYLDAQIPAGMIKLLPFLKPAPPFPPDVDAVLIDRGAFFRGADPAPNKILFRNPPAAPPIAGAVLMLAWSTRPGALAGQLTLLPAGVFGTAVILPNDKTANPTLSWEYFDGQAWRTVANLQDNTVNLRSTGVVSFCVPPGLQSTEVAGRKSYWIRARLVGGDYGQEKVTVHIVPDTTGGGSTQTVERSLSGISPPLLGSLNLSYSVCCPSDPDYIITSDGGDTHDQTVANTTDAAKLELFTPLSTSIKRASSSSTKDSGENDRAVYLGFDQAISGGPINVLFLSEDQDFGDDVYPLRVEVLRETGFEHVVSDDRTRGLGESGVLSFNLTEPPPATTLFGASRRWLRLQPSTRFTNLGDWNPKIRRAYLNAVFASASETQELEHLGSSDGSPRQKVALGRPPVLERSLELRVREPLGDEEVQALRAADPNDVVDKLTTGQLGPWVLWKPIDILEEAAKDERRYSLNGDTGEIAFGDGIHGRIPPIGTDSIVAMTYKRGGGSAANRVTAFSTINLISPIQGVERVVAPDSAAGGSDPQTPEEVIRYAPVNQFMRDRALTLRDFETLAVESSRDIVQARALQSGAGVRLVAVVRGQNPQPTQAQWRELLRYLAERTSPSMAAPRAITKLPPRLVNIQVWLTLTVRSIEFSGEVDQWATKRIVSLLDPATGGLDNQGWPLGLLPTESDIAAAVDDIPNLEAIEGVTIMATFNSAAVQIVRPEDLPVTSPEDIRIEFQIADVEVGA
jgi:hypothetical protein